MRGIAKSIAWSTGVREAQEAGGPRDNTMATRRFSVNEVLGDIRSGLDNTELRRKYELSENGLERLLDKLLVLGVLTQEELDKSKAKFDKQFDLRTLEDVDEADEFEKTIDLSDMGVVAARELDAPESPKRKDPAPSIPERSQEAFPAKPSKSQTLTEATAKELAEFYESGGLKEMMDWWRQHKERGAAGEPAFEGPRPVIGGGHGKQTANITVDREILARAITKAKREAEKTGGTLSLLVELLLFRYIGSPDELIQRPGQKG